MASYSRWLSAQYLPKHTDSGIAVMDINRRHQTVYLMARLANTSTNAKSTATMTSHTIVILAYHILEREPPRYTHWGQRYSQKPTSWREPVRRLQVPLLISRFVAPNCQNDPPCTLFMHGQLDQWLRATLAHKVRRFMIADPERHSDTWQK